MSKKYYAVSKGRYTGVFETWAECSDATQGYSGAAFKSFKTLAEAQAFVSSGSSLSSNSSQSAPTSNDNLIYPSTSPLHTAKPSAVTEVATCTNVTYNTNSSISAARDIIADAKEGDVLIFTDGASIRNPGYSGAGVRAEVQLGEDKIVVEGAFPCGKNTNNYCELRGLKEGATSILDRISNALVARGLSMESRQVKIFTDSEWSVRSLAGMYKNSGRFQSHVIQYSTMSHTLIHHLSHTSITLSLSHSTDLSPHFSRRHISEACPQHTR